MIQPFRYSPKYVSDVTKVSDKEEHEMLKNLEQSCTTSTKPGIDW